MSDSEGKHKYMLKILNRFDKVNNIKWFDYGEKLSNVKIFFCWTWDSNFQKNVIIVLLKLTHPPTPWVSPWEPSAVLFDHNQTIIQLSEPIRLATIIAIVTHLLLLRRRWHHIFLQTMAQWHLLPYITWWLIRLHIIYFTRAFYWILLTYICVKSSNFSKHKTNYTPTQIVRQNPRSIIDRLSY